MKSNGRYIVNTLNYSSGKACIKIRDVKYCQIENFIEIRLTDDIAKVWFWCFSEYDGGQDHSISLIFPKVMFVDRNVIQDEEWELTFMVNNVPQKYLKFIVGLYKLHVNQISTSELEQLVLDNIEDLL